MSDDVQIKEFQSLQDGNRYCKYFRINIYMTLIAAISALGLLIVCLLLIFAPQHPVYYVSSTKGTVAKLNPVTLQSLAQTESKGG